MSTNKKTKIVWKTPGSDIEHTIPSEAVVTLIDSEGKRHSSYFRDGEIWISGYVNLCDSEEDDPEPFF